ncbi:MAG: 3,4-dihydroxy-2-butanone-4-phosphate synthase, partial [Hyphomicrobiales bacterium]
VVAKEGRGVVVLLRDTQMQLEMEDGVSSSTLKQYGLGAQILSNLGLSELILLTNSPSPKVVGLDAYGLSIVGTRSIPMERN